MLFLFVYFVLRQQTFFLIKNKNFMAKNTDVPFSTTYMRKPVRRFNGSFLESLNFELICC